MEGTLVKWLDNKGYGFIRADNGERFFVHSWDIYGTEPICRKQRMEFKVKQTDKGPRAKYVKIIE